jgi:hypothetical protein
VGLLKWQFARFLAAQNTVDVSSGSTHHCQCVRTVADQSSERWTCVDCRHAVMCSQRYDLCPVFESRQVGRGKNAPFRFFRHARDGAFDVSKIMDGQIDRLNRNLPGTRFKPTLIGCPDRIVWIIDHADAGNARSHPF